MFLAETEITPNVIIIFGAMIFAGIKALLDKRQAAKAPPVEEYEEEYDPYLEYEAVLERQRAELGLPTLQKKASPPPIHAQATPAVVLPKVIKPKLTKEERDVIQNLNIPSHRKRGTGLTTKSRLKKHLSSPTAAREALLLSEILGPPKSLK